MAGQQKQVLIIHNPKAGDEQHEKKLLIQTVEKAGCVCEYVSIREGGLESMKDTFNTVVIAGGDGTVRRALKILLKRRLIDRRMNIALFPMGTANNFAKTLGVSFPLNDLSKRISEGEPRMVDIAVVKNIANATFFVEGMGFGIFPRLIKTMRTVPTKGKTAKQELKVADKTLQKIAKDYTAKAAKIWIDGVLHEGKYLLIELVNIRSIGPNLELAPAADPSDGSLHVIMVKEDHREEFITYLRDRKCPPINPCWQIISGKEIQVLSDFNWAHVDDELLEVKKGKKVKTEMRPSVLEFLV